MDIQDLTIRQVNELKKYFIDNGDSIQETKKEIDHGYCIVILDKGFMYIGNLKTDGEFLTIEKPRNIRKYTSGKGLLWHAKNGDKDMILDDYDGLIKAPYSELKHFIPTEKSIWEK